MGKLKDNLVALLRGEPLYLRGLIVAGLAAVGVKVGDGTVDTWIGIVAPIVLALIARPSVTPAANPATPTTIAVRPTNGETPADLPPLSLPPIRTITGQKR